MVRHIQRWRKNPQGKKIVLILIATVTIVLLNVVSGIILNTRYPVEDSDRDSPMPLLAHHVISAEDYIREQRRQNRLAIFKMIFKKQSRFSRLRNETCQHPHLDLQHDGNRYAFHAMPPLNCSGEVLFYLKNNVARINESVLRGKELEDCFYFGIQRVNDDFHTYTESLKKNSPYDLILNHDFLRIRCRLKTSNDGNSREVPDFPQLGHRLISADFKDKDIEMVIRYSQEYPGGVPKGSLAISPGGMSTHDNEQDLQHAQGDFNDKLSNENGMDYQAFFGPDGTDADYDQFLVQVAPKPEVFERIAKIKTPKDSSKMNVLIFALDSMSHLSYQRKLPLTYRYITQELGAAVLDGYNIVGDATTAAIIPMFTGKTEMELPEVRKDREESHFLDVYPMIWNTFKEAGYATLYAEDEPTIGTFNLRFNGFQDPPTDHYMRPLWQAIWESGPRSTSPQYCTGSTPHHRHMITYLHDFFTKYHNVSKFAFGFSGELTHWDNNPGVYIDKDLREFLVSLNEEGHLNNTMLVLMGDHGARYSKVRNTVQGKLEERLPLMSLVLPQPFLRKYPKVKAALTRNRHRLTTPFDIHETFLDILHLGRLNDPIRHDQRGMSVLRDIPDNRTCSSAHVAIHWCACLHQVAVGLEDTFVQGAAHSVVSYINDLTRHVRDNCTALRLGRLVTAFMVLPNEQVLKFKKSGDPDQRIANFSGAIDVDRAHYQIVVETQPSGALYEVTVEVDFRNETYHYIVMPEISRLNLYGDQPKCVQHRHPDLRKYCYCRFSHKMSQSIAHEANRPGKRSAIVS